MVESRVRYFDALSKAAEAINSTQSVDAVLAAIVRATAEATRVKGCALMLLDDDKKYLIHSASYGLSEHYLKKGVIMADQSLAGAMKGGLVEVPDVCNDARLQYPAEAVKEGIAAMLCVPLTVKGKLVGAIRIYSAQTGDFSSSVKELLTAIANLSAIAIQNARLHDSLRQALDTCQRELWHWQP